MSTPPSIYSTVGFTGHVPGYREEVGQTYGHASAQLLSQPPNPPTQTSLKGIVEYYKPSSRERRISDDSFEAPRFPGYMMPGYTGFIPDSHNYFGRDYQYPCRPQSFARLDHGRPRHFRKLIYCQMNSHVKNDERKIVLPCDNFYLLDGGRTKKDGRTGEEQDKEEGRACTGRPQRPPHVSYPQQVDEEGSQRELMTSTMLIPGYTGFVPFRRGVNGVRFAESTKEGLRRFNGCVREGRRAIDLPPGPATMECLNEFEHPNKPIYLVDQGFMNSYSGHLPGHKYRFGYNFGRTTRNLKSFFNPKCEE